MTTFKPARLAVIALLGVMAIGSTACAYDDYRDHHRGHDRGGHGPRGDRDHGRDHDGHGDHRGGH